MAQKLAEQLREKRYSGSWRSVGRYCFWLRRVHYFLKSGYRITKSVHFDG
jgi:hypothetical protein